MSKVILFDGMCNFCDWNVQFIIKHDQKGFFKFASLQSNSGKKLIEMYDIPKDINSLILIENNQYYSKSTAALKICKNLTSIWKLFYIFILIPKPVRDTVYSIIAKHRYKWFGKKTACSIPSPQIRRRFFS